MKKKVFIIIVVLIIAGVASFFIYKKVKQKKEAGSSGTTGGATGTSTFPLKQGSQGENVKLLQNMLNKIVPAELEADGIFGTKTEASLQNKVGLKQLTKNQFEALRNIMSGYVLGTGLRPDEINQIHNA